MIELHQIYAKELIQNYFSEGHNRFIFLYAFIIKCNKSLTELVNLEYPENVCSPVYTGLPAGGKKKKKKNVMRYIIWDGIWE